MTLVQPIPKPTFKRNHAVAAISSQVKHEVDKRSKGLCEGKNCPNRKGDHRGLTYAHRFRSWPRNKGMGGTHRIPTANDIWRACFICHGKEDHHL